MALSKFVWKDGKIIRLRNAKVNIFSPSVQYGWKGFEGIRFYDTEYGPAVFCLSGHLDRLLDTAESLRMKVRYSVKELTEAVCRLILRNEMRQGYIRPDVLYAKAELGLRFGVKNKDNRRELNKITVAIAVASWDEKPGSDTSLKAKISPFVRIHPDSTIVGAKISGHYVNSIFALWEAEESGYDEAILLDYQGYVAEGSAENLFVVKEGVLLTPPLGTILPGITRGAIMQLAIDNKYEVVEKDVYPEELFDADEVFLCGTAMEILPVTSINGKLIGSGKPGETTKFFTELYKNVVRGRMSKYDHWLTYVKDYT